MGIGSSRSLTMLMIRGQKKVWMLVDGDEDDDKLEKVLIMMIIYDVDD